MYSPAIIWSICLLTYEAAPYREHHHRLAGSSRKNDWVVSFRTKMLKLRSRSWTIVAEEENRS